MVPLAEAWDSGASGWTETRREAYANDLHEPRSLAAVTARSNRSKADQDPSTWLPPYVAAQCGYITDWVIVKTRWGLSVDHKEKAVLMEEAGCRAADHGGRQPTTAVEAIALPVFWCGEGRSVRTRCSRRRGFYGIEPRQDLLDVRAL